MTAVIGILNKQAVAIAADSAVTVSSANGRKIYNTANKIFTLSKYHPVSLTIYNSANFITTPWETIIKIYRNELGKTSFLNLKDYSDNFFDFLKKRKFFVTDETIRDHNKSLVFAAFNTLKELSLEMAFESDIDLILLSPDERITLFRKNILEIIASETNELKDEEQLLDFKSFTRKRASELLKDSIKEIIETEFPEFDTKEIRSAFLTMLYRYIKSKSFRGQWTGLVFAGFGENEIYPCTICAHVGDVVDGKARFHTHRIEKIDDGNDGSIMPFAQRDVIDTLFTGISPELNEYLFLTLNKFLNGYNDYAIKLIKKSNPKIADELKSIDLDSICNQFFDELEYVKEAKHIRPIVNTVSVLSKEDLAEMAESLIYLTYLKRRISSAEESVGGPVDVAIISKGDGFIWIKRKHYFEEKYNPHFSKNYFNS